MLKFIVSINKFSRRVHRILVIVSLWTYLVMGVTGLLLRYYWGSIVLADGRYGWQLGNWFFSELAVRALHADYSVYFTIFIGLMCVTGVILYLAPLLIKYINNYLTHIANNNYEKS